MADPASYRPDPGAVPDAPGVYRFSDPEGRVIYVGKAKSLRNRLNSYFQDLAGLHPRTQTMVTTAASVQWTVVGTEVEALQLEYSWIKEFDPRFNVRYRDDKSYPYLAVTLGDAVPRVQVMRGAKRKGVRYFGPYAHAWAIRETVDLLLRVFPVRTCSNGVLARAQQSGRPCLLGYIDRCAAPCVGRVTVEEHHRIAEDFASFLAGQTTAYLKRLEREMRAASAEQDYEHAARLRDDIRALERAMERSAVVLGDGTDADVVAVAEDPLEAAVHVFYVRAGRVRGQRGWVADRVEELDSPELVEHFLQQLYGGESGEAVPREVLVPFEPPDRPAVEAWLSQLRGSTVHVRVPQRGDKRALLETVERNAAQTLALHKTRRAGDLAARGAALGELQESLGLREAPLRIECYDISHHQGDETVASMVVFEDGLPRKGEYRRFKIRTVGSDDVGAMTEVVSRRFRRWIEEASESSVPDLDDVPEVAPGIDPATGRPKRFSYRPQLVVVDGARPQAEAARRALDALGVDDVAVVGLAKRLEEVWLPGEPDPVVLPRTSEGLYLLQRVRDEAHRFAITYHRQRRSRALVASELDAVPGLGPVRRQALVKHFGSVRRLRTATAEEVAEVPGIGAATAQAVVEALAAAPAPVPAVNTATGEVLDAQEILDPTPPPTRGTAPTTDGSPA